MEKEHAEPVNNNPSCEIRLGTSSWHGGTKSIKFTWFDKNGKAARGGEVPVDALPQMLSFAIRKGYLDIRAIE